MPRSDKKARLRQAELLKRLSSDRAVSTVEMARKFRVNPMTIRRDLIAMENSGAAVRCYGGAIAARRITFEFAFEEKRQHNLQQKRRIGIAAAAMVRPAQTIFLDTGTTTLQIARALAARDVPCSAVTSSLMVASELWGRGQGELMLLGGRVRRGSPDLIGPATEIMLEKLTANVAFIGSDGIDPQRGFFSADVETARVAERMAANARRTVVVADGSKLGLAGAARYLKIDQVDELITDKDAPKKIVAALRRQGLTVTLA